MAGKFMKNVNLDLVILVLVCMLIGILLMNCMNNNERYRTNENFQENISELSGTVLLGSQNNNCPTNIDAVGGVRCEAKTTFNNCSPSFPNSVCTIGKKYKVINNEWRQSTCHDFIAHGKKLGNQEDGYLESYPASGEAIPKFLNYRSLEDAFYAWANDLTEDERNATSGITFNNATYQIRGKTELGGQEREQGVRPSDLNEVSWQLEPYPTSTSTGETVVA